jgi:hypothetical protein
MTAPNSATSRLDRAAVDGGYRDRILETKPSTKTSELIAYVAAVVIVALTATIVGNGDAGGGSADPFSANDAMRYITYLTIGYMIARGLAKSGSRTRDDSRNDA